MRDRIWASASRATDVSSIPRLVDQVATPKKLPPSPIVHGSSVPSTPKRRVSLQVDAHAALSAPVTPLQIKREINGSLHDRWGFKSPQEPIDQSSSAFALDFLAHNGHDRVLGLVKSSMARRHLSPADPPLKLPPVGPEPTVSNFPFASSALAHLRRMVLQAHLTPVPWTLIHSLNPEFNKQCPALSHKLEIWDFVRVLRSGDTDSAIDQGKVLLARSREEEWAKDDRAVLDDAFGLLRLEEAELGLRLEVGAWGSEGREKDAEGVVLALRGELRCVGHFRTLKQSWAELTPQTLKA